MLILFDIDGTILLTSGAGVKAMDDAGRELFGEGFTMEGIEFSGRLDTLIWNDLVELNRIPPDRRDHDRFRALYGGKLAARLAANPTARLLPGVADLVDRLSREPKVTVGLLTGNYPETGRLKIRHAGLDPDLFTVAAWGCEGGCRRDLTPLAIERHAKASGRRLDSQAVVIIGDTPHDVDCAKAHGCRAIAVATGAFSVESLWEAGADLAVADLSDTSMLMEWLLGEPSRALAAG